jgi:DNA-binding NarL/FixJ family response regulator
MIRVLIVDDHALMRAGVKVLLEGSGDIRVVGETGDGWKALELMKSLGPDVVLMDISMPGINGLEVAAKARKEVPRSRIVFLSMHGGEEYVLRALKMGAAGYVLKDAETHELEFAIRAAARGGAFLSPSVSGRVIETCIAGPSNRQDKVDPGPYELLTTRQREVLQLIAEGNTTKAIAERTKLSVNTVEAHRTNIMNRLNIHDVAGLVRYAISKGIIQSDP